MRFANVSYTYIFLFFSFFRVNEKPGKQLKLIISKNEKEEKEKKYEKKIERNDHKHWKFLREQRWKRCSARQPLKDAPCDTANVACPWKFSTGFFHLQRVEYRDRFKERLRSRDQGWYTSCSLFNATWMCIHVGNGFPVSEIFLKFWMSILFLLSCVNYFSSKIIPTNSNTFLPERIFVLSFSRAKNLHSNPHVCSIVPLYWSRIDCSIYAYKKKEERKGRRRRERSRRIANCDGWTSSTNRRDFRYREE